MDAMPPLDLDRLLADTAFVRRIARALVRDPDVADDLAQDAVVVALERPPRAGTSLRGWIASVVRSLAIDRARTANARPRMEPFPAAQDRAPGPAEIVARIDLSRQVAAALRELEEPYRTALYLRYVEELDPPSIAARIGVPLATVKTRLRRGLEILRARFDREWGGREAWSALLVPFTAHPTQTSLAAGGILMSTTLKIAAAVCLCGAAAWILWPDARVDSLATASSKSLEPGNELADPGRDDARATVQVPALGATAVEKPDQRRLNEASSVRVLDERRFPVAGAHAVLHVDGLPDDESATDSQGIARFAHLPVSQDERRIAGLLAWDDLGRVGFRPAGASRSSLDARGAGPVPEPHPLGELVLRPGGSIAVRVIDKGAPAAGARVWLEVGILRTPVADAITDAQGHARFEHVPATAVVASAAREGKVGRAEMILAPGKKTDLDVIVLPARTIDLQVIDAESKAPISGAVVAVRESFDVTADGELGSRVGQTSSSWLPVEIAVPPTDAKGRTRIVGLPGQGKYEVSAQAELYVGPQPPRGAARIKPDSDSLVLTLDSLHKRSARWPLEKGEVEAPPSGTALTIRRETVDRFVFQTHAPLPTRARVEDGAIVAEDVCDRMNGCYAVAPDGALARLWVEDSATTGKPTSFRRPRRIDVRVLDAEGRPAVGVVVEVTNEGNNLLLPAGETDENGEVVFEGLWGRRAEVKCGWVPIGMVDLEKGDGRVEGRLPGAQGACEYGPSRGTPRRTNGAQAVRIK